MEDILTEEQKKCFLGIAKCDNFLKNWDMRGFQKGEIKICEYADEIPPHEVVATFKKFNRELVDGGADKSTDFCLVIFYANAKYGFILRLVEIQERENALSMA
jgi:hypothetical protein